MANQLNSAQGIDLKALKKGQVVLTKVIKTENPDVLSLELYEGGIENTSRASSSDGEINGVNMLMSGYKGIGSRKGGVQVSYAGLLASNLELMLGIDELDLENAIFSEYKTKDGRTKEGYELNILNPVAVYNPDLNEECNIRFRVKVTERTAITKDKIKWAKKQGIFDEKKQVEAIVKKFAKTAGTGGAVITHNDDVVYRDRTVTFSNADVVNHTFLKSDPIGATPEKVDVATGELVEEYSEDLG